jgi:predicted TIM-barrel fold metal-dependent hydrolase
VAACGSGLGSADTGIDTVIIDAHTYVNPERDGFGARFDATLAALIRNLDESPVERAIVLPIAADTPYIKRTSNEYVAECCGKHPDRLVGFASVHPLEESDAPGVLERAVRDLNLKGLKIHPRFMGFSASDPRLVPLVRKAGELGVPVAVDCYLWRPTPLHMQEPFHIDLLCKAAPETKIIMCHTGGFRFLDALAVAKANDNVYFDLSLSLTYFHGTPFEEQFMFVLKSIGARRLVYGSDHPQEPLAACYARARDILNENGFSEEDQAWIFGGTIASLLPEGA